MTNQQRGNLRLGWWALGLALTLLIARLVLGPKSGAAIGVFTGLAAAAVVVAGVYAIGSWANLRSSRQVLSRLGSSAIRCSARTPRQRNGYFVVEPDRVSIQKGNGTVLAEWPLAGMRAYRDVQVPYSAVVSRPGLMLDVDPRVFVLFMNPNGLRCPPEALDDAVRLLVEQGVRVDQIASLTT